MLTPTPLHVRLRYFPPPTPFLYPAPPPSDSPAVELRRGDPGDGLDAVARSVASYPRARSIHGVDGTRARDLPHPPLGSAMPSASPALTPHGTTTFTCSQASLRMVCSISWSDCEPPLPPPGCLAASSMAARRVALRSCVSATEHVHSPAIWCRLQTPAMHDARTHRRVRTAAR